ncbi:MAG: hypothetical protein LBT44_00565 [Clostridiales bacterium]|jgi:hypothetical protein|nr:hypothetical protein [Clostridiales bacterium]
MKNDDFINAFNEENVDSFMRYTVPFSEEHARNIKNRFVEKAKRKQKRLTAGKFALACAAACVTLFSTLVYGGVLDLSRIYKIVFGENAPYVEPYMKPLAAAGITESTYDGIVLKLVSAVNDEDVLRVFATLSDTTGDRLSGAIALDDWTIDQGHMGGMGVVDYNKGTKTATLLFTSNGENHTGRVALNISRLIVGSQFRTGLAENNINAYALLTEYAPQTMPQEDVFVNGSAFQSKEGEVLAQKSALLRFGERDITFDNINWASISNIGFVDGCLHIQTKTLSNEENDLAGITFVNADNEVIDEGNLHLNFTNIENRVYQQDAAPYNQYKEIIYEGITNLEQLKDLSVTIDAWERGKVIEGGWQLSFDVPQTVAAEFPVDWEITVNSHPVQIDRLSLSPFGITVHFPDDVESERFSNDHTDLAYAEYVDGTRIELNQVSFSRFEEVSTLYFRGNIVEMEKVRRIGIGGKVIDVTP